MILLVIVGLSLLFYRHNFSSSDKKFTVAEQIGSSYQRILDANLEKLQDLQKEAIAIKKHYSNPLVKIPSISTYSHARISASTRVYSGRQVLADQTLFRGQSRSQSHLQPQSQTAYAHRIFIEATPYANFANHQSELVQARAAFMLHPQSTVAQGELIDAVLETPIRSDLPGMVRAMVVTPVYSYLGDHLLIPKGSRLIGQYASFMFQTISRVMVIWQRIILPSGVSIFIDSPGSDELGRSGLLATHTDTHFFQRVRQACFLSLFRIALSKKVSSSYLDDEMIRSVEKGVEKSLPTSLFIRTSLLIDQGAHFNVFVARDLDFFDTLKQQTDAEYGN